EPAADRVLTWPVPLGDRPRDNDHGRRGHRVALVEEPARQQLDAEGPEVPGRHRIARGDLKLVCRQRRLTFDNVVAGVAVEGERQVRHGGDAFDAGYGLETLEKPLLEVQLRALVAVCRRRQIRGKRADGVRRETRVN